MGQGILPFVFEGAPPMDLTARAGLTLVSETMLALGLDEVVRDLLRVRTRRRGSDEFEKLHAIVLIQAAGGGSVEDVRVLARDAGLQRLLGRSWPLPDALHFLAAIRRYRSGAFRWDNCAQFDVTRLAIGASASARSGDTSGTTGAGTGPPRAHVVRTVAFIPICG